MSNQSVENLIEDVLPKAVTKVSEGAVGRGLEEIEVAKETEPGIIAQSRSKLAVGADLTQVD